MKATRGNLAVPTTLQSGVKECTSCHQTKSWQGFDLLEWLKPHGQRMCKKCQKNGGIPSFVKKMAMALVPGSWKQPTNNM